MKKPKRRRTASGRNQGRTPAAPTLSTRDSEIGDTLAGMLRARLALMPRHVAGDYHDLALKADLTLAEKARVSVLEDTYSPSSQQIQAAISEAHAEIKRNRKVAR
nr:hypothetical protein [uncultured Rhodopila sp.]